MNYNEYPLNEYVTFTGPKRAEEYELKINFYIFGFIFALLLIFVLYAVYLDLKTSYIHSVTTHMDLDVLNLRLEKK